MGWLPTSASVSASVCYLSDSTAVVARARRKIKIRDKRLSPNTLYFYSLLTHRDKIGPYIPAPVYLDR